MDPEAIKLRARVTVLLSKSTTLKKMLSYESLFSGAHGAPLAGYPVAYLPTLQQADFPPDRAGGSERGGQGQRLQLKKRTM